MEIKPQELFFDEINLGILIFNYFNREYYEEVLIQETEIFWMKLKQILTFSSPADQCHYAFLSPLLSLNYALINFIN